MPLENEHRESDSPYIQRVWRSTATGVERMTSIASATTEFVFWRHRGRTFAAINGPESGASTADVPDDSDSFGIVLAHGASLVHLASAGLVDRMVASPRTTDRDFLLAGEEWEIPAFESAEQFATRLVRAGLLVRDPLVDDVIAGGLPEVGSRSVQRRVAAATGLTAGSIRQIERARAAALLLGEGSTPLEVVAALGYYDQPHLARSLQRFIGRTATELRSPDPGAQPLSLLYKTEESTPS